MWREGAGCDMAPASISYLRHCCLLVAFTTVVVLQLSSVCPVNAHGTKWTFPAQSVRVMLDSTDQVQLVPNVTAFSKDGQFVSLRVQRATHSADADDIIALYTHPSDPQRTVPVTWLNITAHNSNYPTIGTGIVVFKFLNFRQEFIFRLLQNGTFSPIVVAESAVIKNTIPNAPSQVHLALHADGQSYVVQWVSGSGTAQLLQYSSTLAGKRLSTKQGSSVTSADTKQIVSTSRTYTADMMCGEPATTFGFISPGFMHTALIPGAGAAYNKQVEYRVGSPEVGWSDVFSFTSQPDPVAVNKGKESFTFLVFNDVGQENLVLFNDTCPPYCPGGWQWENYTVNSTKLVNHLLSEKDARLGLLVGDLSYANGVQADWDYFGHQFEPVFSRWPLAVATGNHERDAPNTGDVLNSPLSDSGGECNVPYTYRYYTPAWEAAGQYAHKGAAGSRSNTSTRTKDKVTIASTKTGNAATSKANPTSVLKQILASLQSKAASGGAWWQQQQQQRVQSLPQWLNPYKSYYSFDMGNVHFLMLDSETASNPGSEQHKFVADDLAKVDRSKCPWLIVGLHRQMNGPTTNAVNIQNLARLQADYEDLFKQYKVDVVLQGHDHAYARTCPMYQGKCVTAVTRNSRLNTNKPLGSSKQGGASVQVYDSPAAPIYVLAGHAGAGFTHAFPPKLPDWVEYGVQDRNGYLRVTVSGNVLTLLSISTDDGHVMDGVSIVKELGKQH